MARLGAKWVAAAVVLACCASAARADGSVPRRFMPHSDSGLIQQQNQLDGSVWAAWTYGQRGESDIAVARIDERGFWTEPILLGAGDGVSQAEPAMVSDHNGHLYLAWTEVETGRVMLSVLPYGFEQWGVPQVINDVKGSASSPALMVAASRRLVVGFYVNGTVRLVELRLLPKGTPLQGMSDGPDPTGMSDDSGAIDEDEETEDEIIDEDEGIMDIVYVGEVPYSPRRR